MAAEADIPEAESDKFELLVHPSVTSDVAEETPLFSDTLAGPFVNMETPCRFSKLPAPTEHFVGRQRSMYVSMCGVYSTAQTTVSTRQGECLSLTVLGGVSLCLFRSRGVSGTTLLV